MPEAAAAQAVIDETLCAIAEDEVASLVSGAVRSAWNGQRFDESALFTELRVLAESAGEGS